MAKFEKTIKVIKEEEKIIKYKWKHYKTILIFMVILLTLEAYLTGDLERFLSNLGNYGYIGAFVAGIFFTYGITTPIAIATFFLLSENLNIWILTFIGSIGGLISEYFIYDFARKKAGKSIKIYKDKKIILPKIKSKLIKMLSPIIAGIIIATPIPDEFVAVLFGIEKYKLRNFLILTFVFKFLGILFIVGLGRIF
ncbi:MAG: hypothetical protein QXD55_01900 [Candidatus Aenigmatarchaeota archaeon]